MNKSPSDAEKSIVEKFIDQRFPSSKRARDYYSRIWRVFSSAGLGDYNFITELTSTEDGRFEQRAWEMILACRLISCGHVPNSQAKGPDFCINFGHRKIWIEAIVPTPTGFPRDWLTPPRLDGVGEAVQVPFESILLRWTAALKEKREKLEGRPGELAANLDKPTGYLRAGIVGKEDVYVVAIDPCRLHSSRPIDEGSSQLPFAVEAVFPVGPLAIPITREGRHGKLFRT